MLTAVVQMAVHASAQQFAGWADPKFSSAAEHHRTLLDPHTLPYRIGIWTRGDLNFVELSTKGRPK